MYTLIDKFQDTNNQWVYTFSIDQGGNGKDKIDSIISRNELTEDELNNFIIKSIFQFECSVDYSDFCEIIKSRAEYYDMFHHLKEESF